MSRLNYMQGCELAIHTVAEELGFLERRLASGAKMASDDLQDLNSCLKQLQQILDGCQRQASSKWQEDSQPLPAWLQREQTSSNSKHEEGEEPGSAVAGHAYPARLDGVKPLIHSLLNLSSVATNMSVIDDSPTTG